jgi:hypothetical protein
MTLDELAERVRDGLNRPNLGGTTIEGFARNVEGELNRALAEHPQMRRIALWPPEDPAKSEWEFVPVPRDMLKLYTLRVDGGTPLRRYPPHINLSAPGFQLYGNQFRLYPPLAAGSRAEIDYGCALDPLRTGAEPNWVARMHPDVYFYGSMKEAARWQKDTPSFQLWSGEFQARVMGLRNQGWGEAIGSVPRVSA